MSSKYKVRDDSIPHFVTSTVIHWIDALSRPAYKDILLGSLEFCRKEKGMIPHAWVIMSNHIHLILSAASGYFIKDIIRDFKKFTSTNVTNAIKANPQESRKEWMMHQFEWEGAHNINNERIQFWQQDYHPIMLDTREKAGQRLHYLHHNPVRAGLVWEPEHYCYSSAVDYVGGKGLLPVVLLDL